MITMPTKGKLLLTAVSIVNWIAECASFRTERKSVAVVRSGTRAKVSFQCNLCDSNYIGYMSRHLHLRIEEYKIVFCHQLTPKG